MKEDRMHFKLNFGGEAPRHGNLRTPGIQNIPHLGVRGEAVATDGKMVVFELVSLYKLHTVFRSTSFVFTLFLPSFP